MKILDYVVWFGVLIVLIVWYMPIVLNELGRETGIIWMCGVIILTSLPFLMIDRIRKHPNVKSSEVKRE